jgi:hypothetical protein
METADEEAHDSCLYEWAPLRRQKYGFSCDAQLAKASLPVMSYDVMRKASCRSSHRGGELAIPTKAHPELHVSIVDASQHKPATTHRHSRCFKGVP